MRRTTRAATAVAVAVVVSISGASAASAYQTERPRETVERSTYAARVPVCKAEDELAVGVGNYEHGRWSRFECIHVDALAETLGF